MKTTILCTLALTICTVAHAKPKAAPPPPTATALPDRLTPTQFDQFDGATAHINAIIIAAQAKASADVQQQAAPYFAKRNEICKAVSLDCDKLGTEGGPSINMKTGEITRPTPAKKAEVKPETAEPPKK